MNCPFFTEKRNILLNNNTCLDENLYSSVENLSKCVYFMQFIMDECKDILS